MWLKKLILTVRTRVTTFFLGIFDTITSPLNYLVPDALLLVPPKINKPLKCSNIMYNTPP